MCMIVSWMMLNVHFMESWDHSISTQMWCASQMRDTSSAAVAIRIFCSWWASCSSFSTKEARNCYSKQFITFCNNLTMLNILWHSKYVENMFFASCFHNMNPSPAPHFATKTCVVPRRPSPSTASRTAARRFSRSLRSANHACDGGSQQSAIFMPFLMGKNSWSKEVKYSYQINIRNNPQILSYPISDKPKSHCHLRKIQRSLLRSIHEDDSDIPESSRTRAPFPHTLSILVSTKFCSIYLDWVEYKTHGVMGEYSLIAKEKHS